MLTDRRVKMNPIKVLIDSFILMELAFLWSQVNGSDASCTSEQVQRCKNAAQGGDLGKLGAGGQCEKQQYVHYTHTCTLNLYLPDVDYCCCTYETKVLCCRYNQNLHDMFRCQFDQDAIDTLAQGTGGSSNGDHIYDRSEGLPLKYLLPAILVPILIVGCCLVCCVKCCLHNEDCDEIRSCWRNKDKKKTLEIEETSSSPTTGFHHSSSYQFPSSHGGFALGQYEREPLNNPTSNHFHQMIMPIDPPKRPLEEIMEADRLMPSAPGVDEIHDDMPYMRSISAPVDSDIAGFPAEPCTGDFTHIHCGPHNNVHRAQPQHPQPSSHVHFMHHPHSYPGCMINRQDSAISNISAPARGHEGHSSGGHGDRNSQCPNCSAKPPTYSESLAHPVMDQQGESPPYSPPGSPEKSS